MFIGLHVKLSLYLSYFIETRISRQIFEKNTRISNFMKLRPMVTELFRADIRTNRDDETNSRFSQFCQKWL